MFETVGLGIAGLLMGIALLIWLALRDVNIIFASILGAVLVILTNGLPFAQSLTQSFLLSDLGACAVAWR